MRFALHIAFRYLFSKKGHNAINIVSAISAAAVGVVSAAMVCVLSVMNGFGGLVEKMFSEFDSEWRITASQGKTFRTDSQAVQNLYALPFVENISEVVEETALARYKDHQQPVRLMGVDSVFNRVTHIDSILTDGYYSTYDGAFDRCVIGRGLAQQIGINAHFVGAIHLYAPKRTEKVNILRPDNAFAHEHCFIAGTFAVNQVTYDDQVMLSSIALARRLFEYDDKTVTSLRLKIRHEKGYTDRQIKKEIEACLGEGYIVADRYEQQADFFRILKVEKLLTAILLVFILLIACFNIIGSLSMLIIDKEQDIEILHHLGASKKEIQKIFLLEGWLISSLGAGIGLIIGVVVCLLQQHLGLLKLGNGLNYVISAYPVEVQGLDILFVGMVVLGLGFLSAWYASRTISKKNQA